jgi:ribosomal protein L37AE/L43A
MAAPTITSAAAAAFVNGYAGTFTVTSTGSPAFTASPVDVAPYQPAIAPTTVAVFNPLPTPVNVVLTGGTVTVVSVNGTTVATSSPAVVQVPAFGSIALTYSVAPTWLWYDPDGSPAMPAGVTFTDNGNGTATIAGTPYNECAWPIVITASNGTAPNAIQVFILTVSMVSIPGVLTLKCPKCKTIRLFRNTAGGLTYRCSGCEWYWSMGTTTPSGTTNAAAVQNATALAVASGGASFTGNMLLLVDTGTAAEVVTVTATGSATSIPVTAMTKAHATATTFAQLLVTPLLGQDVVPALPGIGGIY